MTDDKTSPQANDRAEPAMTERAGSPAQPGSGEAATRPAPPPRGRQPLFRR